MVIMGVSLQMWVSLRNMGVVIDYVGVSLQCGRSLMSYYEEEDCKDCNPTGQRSKPKEVMEEW